MITYIKLIVLFSLFLSLGMQASPPKENYTKEFQGFQVIAEKLVQYKRKHGKFPDDIKSLALDEYKSIPNIKMVLESSHLIYNPNPKSSDTPILLYQGKSIIGKVMSNSEISINRK